MKGASSGDVGLVSVLDGVGRGRDSLVLSCMWQGSAFANSLALNERRFDGVT